MAGIAAVNVGGITIHRWSGIGISPKREEQMSRAWNHKKNWRDTDVLIIDEISMVFSIKSSLLIEYF